MVDNSSLKIAAEIAPLWRASLYVAATTCFETRALTTGISDGVQEPPPSLPTEAVKRENFLSPLWSRPSIEKETVSFS